MKKRLYILSGLLMAACMSSCIKNDIPYPTILGDITAFEVGGEISCNIDPARRTVRIDLADSVNPARVRLIRMEVSNQAVVTPEITSVVNLTTPLTYTLTTYQEYPWTIIATQTIERYFQVENQIGETIFDADAKIALVTVTADTDLKKVKVTGAKIAPSGSRITPDPLGVTDFSRVVEFQAEYHQKSEKWTVMLVKSDVSVVTVGADPFARYALLSGQYKAGSDTPTFEYKKKGVAEWSKLPTAGMILNGSSFTAKLSSLDPETEYLYRAVSGPLYGAEKGFKTEKAAQIPNLNFDDWFALEDKSKTYWYPNKTLDVTHYWWDSGNKGANMFSSVNPTAPTSEVAVAGAGKQAARLETKMVAGLALAAGNIYLGQFGKTIGTSGAEIYFGRAFASRPISLRGYYNYAPKSIDNVRDPYKDLKGQPDVCHIYVILTDWASWYPVNTSEKRFVDVQNDPGIIAYGELQKNENTNGYQEFNIELKYRNSRKPTYCVLVASASKYGDYFTGGAGSLLLIDEFEFVY